MAKVVVVGAGPAGASLAYLLASRGIETTLVERRRDFSREFRGEILMPSGHDALNQMGLSQALTGAPHHAILDFALYLNAKLVFEFGLEASDFHGSPPVAISQPLFLENVVKTASALPEFEFVRGVSVRAIDTPVRGVTVRDETGERVIPCDVVIGADGRYSAVRKLLGFEATSMSPPMDIVWCKLPLPAVWPGVKAFVGRGHLLVAYQTWDGALQLGWVILKGTFGELRDKGVEEWVDVMANHVTPELGEHLRAHTSNLEKPFLLESVSDCVTSWSQEGVLLVGDAAHTMSPVGGQGINVALRDAIVAANHLVPALKTGSDLNTALNGIEAERCEEIRVIQEFQAQPPKLILTNSWWGEPLRGLAGMLLRRPAVRERIVPNLEMVLYGIDDVELRV